MISNAAGGGGGGRSSGTSLSRKSSSKYGNNPSSACRTNVTYLINGQAKTLDDVIEVRPRKDSITKYCAVFVSLCISLLKISILNSMII